MFNGFSYNRLLYGNSYLSIIKECIDGGLELTKGNPREETFAIWLNYVDNMLQLGDRYYNKSLFLEFNSQSNFIINSSNTPLKKIFDCVQILISLMNLV